MSLTIRQKKIQARVLGRAYKILEIAKGLAEQEQENFAVSNVIEFIQLYTQYCEKGRNVDLKSHVIATGNWNEVKWDKKHIIPRLQRIFEKMGIEIEWYDNVAECAKCHGLIEVVPSSIWWQPQFKVVENVGHVCAKCKA